MNSTSALHTAVVHSYGKLIVYEIEQNISFIGRKSNVVEAITHDKAHKSFSRLMEFSCIAFVAHDKLMLQLRAYMQYSFLPARFISIPKGTEI